MQTRSRTGPARHLLARAVALLCFAAICVAVVVEFARAIGPLHDRSDSPAPPEARLLAAAYSIDISRNFLLAARELIAENESYVIEAGPNVSVSTPVTLIGLRAYTGYWLLPRREEPSPVWLLCYGCDLGPWRDRIEIRWDAEPGLAIARIVR